MCTRPCTTLSEFAAIFEVLATLVNGETERFTVWHGLLLAEGAALMIALLMPITPSKTGSDWSVSELFIPGPSYLQEVLVYFAFTNLLLLVIAVIVFVWLKLKRG